MLRIFFVFLFLCSKAFACKPINEDAEYIAQSLINKNPEKAKIVFSGIIIQGKGPPEDIFLSGDINLIVPEVKWTNVEFKKIQTSSICRVNQKVGDRYLFLADSPKSYRVLVKLEEAGEYITKLARKKDFIGDVNPAWLYCKKDKDCLAIKDKCNIEKAVSVYHKNDYLEFLKEQNKGCSNKGNYKKVIFKCINYFCS